MCPRRREVAPVGEEQVFRPHHEGDTPSESAPPVLGRRLPSHYHPHPPQVSSLVGHLGCSCRGTHASLLPCSELAVSVQETQSLARGTPNYFRHFSFASRLNILFGRSPVILSPTFYFLFIFFQQLAPPQTCAARTALQTEGVCPQNPYAEILTPSGRC